MVAIGKKMRKDGEAPYLTITSENGFFGGPARWDVLKSYQNDNTKQYARWLCRVTTPMTGPGGDIGDTYVTDAIMARDAKLSFVDGEVPSTEDIEWFENLRHYAKLPNLGW